MIRKRDIMEAIMTYFQTHNTGTNITAGNTEEHFFSFILSGKPSAEYTTATHITGREDYVHDVGHGQGSFMTAYIALKDKSNEAGTIFREIRDIQSIDTILMGWFPVQSLSSSVEDLIQQTNRILYNIK